MTHAEACRRYGAVRLATMTALDAFFLLCERAIEDLSEAKAARARGDRRAEETLVRHAREIVLELFASLDRTQGGEVAERLASLYGFLLLRLKSPAKDADFDLARTILGTILDGYRAIQGMGRGGI
jgi:flagellin-specific chaperone FliS